MKPEYDARVNGLRDAFWIVHNLYIGSTISTHTEAKRKLRKILKQNECDDSFIEGINDDIATGFAVAVGIIKNAIEDKLSKLQEHGEAEKPKTNADKIRAMTDEKLATFLESFGCCHNCSEHHRLGGVRFYSDEKCDEQCQTHLMDWLKQPAEVSE